MPALIESITERLILRQWQRSDREPFARMNADPKVMEFFPKLLDRAESDALVDRIEAKMNDRGWGWWAVEIQSTQEFIGFAGLNIPAVEFPFSPCVEVGWRLAFPYWGKGYASEAGREALRIGFEVLNLTEIVSFTAVPNGRSRRVMERLKMRQIPETFLHPSLPPEHPLAEHYLYKLTRQEFQGCTNLN